MPRIRLATLPIVFCTAVLLGLAWLPILRVYTTGHLLSARGIEVAFWSPLARSLFFNTAFMSLGAAGLAVLIGAPIAIAAARGPRWLRVPILLLSALPLALPPTLVASAFLEWTRTPPARSMASLASQHALTIDAIFVAAPILALCFYPLVSWAMWAALQQLPREWEEAARLFGGDASVWGRVLLPLLAPVLLGAASLVGAFALWEMGAPDLVDARTYSVQIYRAYSAGGGSGAAAIASLPMFVLGLLFFVPGWRALTVCDSWKFDALGIRSADRKESRSWSWLFALPLLFASPLSALFIFWNQAQPRDVFPEVWDANHDEIINTVLAPGMAAVAIVAIALMFVLAWRQFSPRAQRTLSALSLTPLLASPILLAVSMIELYNVDALSFLYNSRYGWLLAGLITRYLPIGILWLQESGRRIPANLDEAAQNLGASKPYIAATILAPLLSGTCVAVAAVLFSLCAGELSLSVLLNNPGGQTLPVPIFNQMHIGAIENVAALSLTLVAVDGGVLLILLALWAKLRNRA